MTHRLALTLTLLGATMLSTTGCTTSRAPTRRVYIYLQEDSTFLVRGKEVSRKSLASHLASIGATRRTWISLVAPVDTPPEISRAILREIARGGFPVVTAEGPKRVTVETKNKRTPPKRTLR